jgi:hypothetical protein
MAPSNANFKHLHDYYQIRCERYATQGYPKTIIFYLFQSRIKRRCTREIARKITDLKANPKEMESEAEHLEVPKERAAVKPVGGLRMRHRGRNQAAWRRGEPKEPTRGICGSRRKLTAACRKVSRRAVVARRKENSAPGKLWTAQGIGSCRNKDGPQCWSGTA